MPGSASLLIRAQTRPVPVEAATILDGFTITGGNADGQYPDNRGGGMAISYYSAPTLANLTVTGTQAEYGGGMYNYWFGPTLTNVTLSGNSAGGSGGGMYNDASSPILINSFRHHLAMVRNPKKQGEIATLRRAGRWRPAKVQHKTY